MAFYEGKQFPAEYRGDIFASQHGSWNRSVRVGYEVIRVPMHQTSRASGEFEDFVTGFVIDNGHVWGRPVGVTVAQDGSLMMTDDGSNSIWRISYTGTASQKSAQDRDQATQPSRMQASRRLLISTPAAGAAKVTVTGWNGKGTILEVSRE